MLLLKLIKATTLTLLHGCFDAERGFPLTGILLPSDRSSMSERVLNPKLCIIDRLNTWRQIRKVFYFKELLTFVSLAQSKYQAYLESKIKEQAAERSVQDKERN